MVRAFGTALLIGAAAAYLLFGHSPGAGLAVFTLAAVTVIALSREGGFARCAPHLAILAAIVAATAAQSVLRPSVTNTAVAFLLATYTAAFALLPARRPAVFTLLEGCAKLVAAPLRPFQVLRHAGGIGRAIRTSTAPVARGARASRRAAAMALPAVVVAAAFLVLLSLGNGVLGHAISTAFGHLARAFYDFRLPSPARMVFGAFVAAVSLALLWRSGPSRLLARAADVLSRSLAAPADQALARARTVLLLAAVNAVFFAANTIDAVYLWAGAGLPEHLTLSAFVHEGAANLLVSVLAAAVVLSALFQQHGDVVDNGSVRHLAIAWIAQNLFLTASVARRLHDYVDNYGLSLLRLYLLLFLALTAAGFVLLAVRVLKKKPLAWLVAANLTAFAVLAVATQFVDLRKAVARTNFHLAQEWKETHVNHRYIDTSLLADLGPSAWPTLVEVAESSPVAGKAPGFSRHEIANARSLLREIGADHLSAGGRGGWQSFSIHRRRSLAVLSDYIVRSRTTARVETVE